MLFELYLEDFSVISGQYLLSMPFLDKVVEIFGIQLHNICLKIVWENECIIWAIFVQYF